MPSGATPGERRGGRGPGIPNSTLAHRTMREILESLEHDPIRALIRRAQDEDTDPELSTKIDLELVGFLFPKLRSMELKTDLGDASDFLALRELLTSYRAWKRAQGLPLAGALPEGPPTEPFAEDTPADSLESRTVRSPESTEPPPTPPAPRSNGVAKHNGKANGKANGKKHNE